MSEPQTLHAIIRATVESLAPDASRTDLYAAERRILQPLVAMLVIEGYKVGEAAKLIGMRDSTIRSWASSDPDFAALIEHAKEAPRRKLKAILWRKAESEIPGTPGVGQAINKLSDLVFPELREKKIEANITSAPKPGESRSRILERVNRGKSVDDDDAI